MEEQTDFLSPSHKRLLTVATWAKYLAWIVLVVYVLFTFGNYIQTQTYFVFNNTIRQERDFTALLSNNHLYAVSFLVESLGIVLKGFFLTLKGISLGLNMIVETNINYRELKDGNNEQ